jgi:uncharacterized protein
MPNAPYQIGSVVSLFRYPVKSMMGEELNAADVSQRGFLGDRYYALVDDADGMVASAKNPRKWPTLFDFRATFTEPPQPGMEMPSVRITLPDGTMVTNEQSNFNQTLSEAFHRKVTLHMAKHEETVAVSAEEYWPDIDDLDYRNTVTEFTLPEGTFFDCAPIHLLTTATMDRLRELYPQGRFEAKRFRPNIVVAPLVDQKDFIENDWVSHTLLIGREVRLYITAPCARCVMTTLSQGDLPRDLGILRTAAQNNKANVGVYAAVIQGGTIHRGDVVQFEQ